MERAAHRDAQHVESHVGEEPRGPQEGERRMTQERRGCVAVSVQAAGYDRGDAVAKSIRS
jgi:hypothetical protein